MPDSTLTQRPLPERFQVAFSFAGEERNLVRQVAEAVEQLLGVGTVFYDEWYEGFLSGTSSDLKLQKIYGGTAEVVVMCASAAYGTKAWTLAEWDSIRARHMKLRSEGDGVSNRLLPLRVAEGEVEGLLGNTIWIDARRRTPAYLAEVIAERVRMFVPEAGRPRVYLAQVQADLEDESKPVNRQRLSAFLKEECQCAVSPTNDLLELDRNQYQDAMRTELGLCLAFVQLLSPRPWKPGRYDELQFRQALDRNLRRFCFRGELRLDTVADEQHRTFLAGSDGIAGGFEDFKQVLKQALAELTESRRADVRRFQEADRRNREGTGSENEDGGADQPLVRIAIRAGNEQAVFEPVFSYLVDQKRIEIDNIGVNGSLLSIHESDPCHGFLILCDELAQSDDACSPRDVLAQCRQIQLRMRDASRIPPVGVVFQAPPAPAWSRLLKCTPKCLHRVLGDDLERGLSEFLKQARGVRSAMK